MVTVPGHETRSVVLREVLQQRTSSDVQFNATTWATVAGIQDGFVDSDPDPSLLHPDLGTDPRARRWQKTGVNEITAFIEPARAITRETLSAGFSDSVWLLNATVAAAVVFNTAGQNATATVLEITLEAAAGASRGPGMGALVRARWCNCPFSC